ncbi:MAG: SEC-C domain-containing protein [Bacteroidales bacterium]|jgi:hypothetical protein|nr:SEC-C domain-containing protein [Bacteroidales bacterium]
MIDIFGADIPVRLKKADMAVAISDYIKKEPDRWLSFMFERDLRLVRMLLDLDPGKSVHLDYPDYESVLEFYGLVESDVTDENFRKLWLSEEVRGIVSGHVDKALENGVAEGRFAFERVAIGFLNLYGVMTFNEFMDCMIDYSRSINDSDYARLLASLKKSPLLKICRFSDYVSSPCASDPLDILKGRKRFKRVKKPAKFKIEDAVEAGKDAPYFVYGADTVKGKAVIDMLSDLGYPETAIRKEMHDIWINSQTAIDTESAQDLFISVIRKENIISGPGRYDFCLRIVADYANSLPKWLLKGRSPDNSDYMKIILQAETDADIPDDMIPFPVFSPDSDAIPENMPHWHLPDPVFSDGYPDLPIVEVSSESVLSGLQFGMAVRHVAPDDPCPCGSGLKYKFCHGRHLS